jgi:hypothetical protein
MTTTVKVLLGAAIGAAIGLAMYKFVGCKTGACPMTANPWIAMAIFGLLGAMTAGGR